METILEQTAQERFDQTYISTSEICKELQVTRATVLEARKRRLLPDPIVVNPVLVYLWERETVRPYLNAWKIILNARRGNVA